MEGNWDVGHLNTDMIHKLRALAQYEAKDPFEQGQVALAKTILNHNGVFWSEGTRSSEVLLASREYCVGL